MTEGVYTTLNEPQIALFRYLTCNPAQLLRLLKHKRPQENLGECLQTRSTDRRSEIIPVLLRNKQQT